MKLRSLVPILSLVYAVVRYVVFGDVHWSQIPLFILNKTLAMNAAVSLALSAWYGWRKLGSEDIRFWGRQTLHCGGLHILMTLMLLPGGYYPQLLDVQVFSTRGNFALLFGVLSAYSCWQLTVPEPRCLLSKAKLLIVLDMMLILHLFFLGIKGWLDVPSWPGYMLPISLVCFVICLFGLLCHVKSYVSGHQS